HDDAGNRRRVGARSMAESAGRRARRAADQLGQSSSTRRVLNPPMRQRLSSLGLGEIDNKLEAGVRLSFDDGLKLFDCPDTLALGWLANREREKRHGARTYYNFNIRLEATNVCVASCLFCSFARLQPGDP